MIVIFIFISLLNVHFNMCLRWPRWYQILFCWEIGINTFTGLPVADNLASGEILKLILYVQIKVIHVYYSLLALRPVTVRFDQSHPLVWTWFLVWSYRQILLFQRVDDAFECGGLLRLFVVKVWLLKVIISQIMSTKRHIRG